MSDIAKFWPIHSSGACEDPQTPGRKTDKGERCDYKENKHGSRNHPFEEFHNFPYPLILSKTPCYQ